MLAASSSRKVFSEEKECDKLVKNVMAECVSHTLTKNIQTSTTKKFLLDGLAELKSLINNCDRQGVLNHFLIRKSNAPESEKRLLIRYYQKISKEDFEILVDNCIADAELVRLESELALW